VPVVSTRCGGPEDYVKPGVTGELVEEKTADAFAQMIKNLCLNREKRHQLSIASVDWIKKNASEDVLRREFRKHLTCYAEEKGYKID
jgi:glycosyltransferase involved in cell wall biosynthesis